MKVFRLLLILFFMVGFIKLGADNLSLQQCIDLAKKNNPDFKISYYNVKKGKLDYLGSYTPFIPGLNARVSGSKITRGPSSQVKVDPSTGLFFRDKKYTQDYYSASISSGITLFDIGLFFRIRAQKSYYNAIKDQHKQQELDLILNVKTKYYNILAYKKLYEASVENVKRSRNQLKKIEEMYKLGLKSQLDVIKQKGLLGQAVLDSLTNLKNYKQALSELNKVLGINPDSALNIQDEFDTNYVELDYNKLVDYALHNHPSISYSKSNLKANKYYLWSNFSNYLPKLSAGFSHSWSDNKLNKINNFFKNDYSRSLYVGLTWNIFDGFTREINLNKQRYNYYISKENFKKTKLSLIDGIKKAFLSVEEAKEKIRINKLNYESAKEEFRLAQEKYNLGSGSFLDLLDAQVNLINTQSQLIYSLYNYKISLAVLENTSSFPIK